MSTNKLAIGDFREVTEFNYNYYCKGLVPFVAYYGGILVVILATNYFFKQGKKREGVFTPEDFVLYEIFLLGVTCLPCFLFLTDFVNCGPRAWIKSRFVEIPVYLILFMFFYFVHHAGTRAQKIFISLILVLYLITPFLATRRPEQIWRNLDNFLELQNH